MEPQNPHFPSPPLLLDSDFSDDDDLNQESSNSDIEQTTTTTTTSSRNFREESEPEPVILGTISPGDRIEIGTYGFKCDRVVTVESIEDGRNEIGIETKVLTFRNHGEPYYVEGYSPSMTNRVRIPPGEWGGFLNFEYETGTAADFHDRHQILEEGQRVSEIVTRAQETLEGRLGGGLG